VGIFWVTARTDEPEIAGRDHGLASREKLDNLIFCGELQFAPRLEWAGGAAQRADYQEAGIGVPAGRAGGTLLRCCGAAEWDPILERDTEGLLVKRHGRVGGWRVSEAGGVVGRLTVRRAFLLGATRDCWRWSRSVAG